MKIRLVCDNPMEFKKGQNKPKLRRALVTLDSKLVDNCGQFFLTPLVATYCTWIGSECLWALSQFSFHQLHVF